MNFYKSCLLVAAAAFTFTHASAQTSSTSPNYTAAEETGTILKQQIRWTSKVPLNKTYGELNPEQIKALHSMYEGLPTGDEPPFPLEGIKPIFSSIKNAQRALQARGSIDMKVTVGPDGLPVKVDDVSTTRSPQMLDLAQRVLMATKYKPAMCSGQPCTMQFRFTQKLKS